MMVVKLVSGRDLYIYIFPLLYRCLFGIKGYGTVYKPQSVYIQYNRPEVSISVLHLYKT